MRLFVQLFRMPTSAAYLPSEPEVRKKIDEKNELHKINTVVLVVHVVISCGSKSAEFSDAATGMYETTRI